MRIAINTDFWPQSDGPPIGPLIFSQRLKEALREFNEVVVVSPNDYYDIILGIVSMRSEVIRPGAKMHVGYVYA